MAKDLRTFLAELEPGQVKVVRKPVDPEFEVTALVDRMEDDPAYPGFPAVLCENVGGSEIPLLINLHGTYERLARSIGADVHSMVPEYALREGSGIKPVTVDTAPVQEVVLTGDDIDVGLLPLLKHQELDAGKYITSAVTICRDPDSGKINAGIFRHQQQGRDQVGIQVNPAHHTAYVLRKLREQRKPMEVALVIGHHPALLMGAVSKLEGIGGELDVVGGLLGEPLEMVPCKTVDLEVPARAEIVIEGVIDTDPDATAVEGPFGEYPRFYTRTGPQPYVKITAITMRRKPIFVDVFNAHTEHSMLGGLPRMGSIYRRVKEAVPTVTGVHLPLSGMARSHLYLSMSKRVEGEPKLAACAALAVDPAAQARVRGRRRRRRVQRSRDAVVPGDALPGRPRPDDHAGFPRRPAQPGDLRAQPGREGPDGDEADLRLHETRAAGGVPAVVPGTAGGGGAGGPPRAAGGRGRAGVLFGLKVARTGVDAGAGDLRPPRKGPFRRKGPFTMRWGRASVRPARPAA